MIRGPLVDSGLVADAGAEPFDAGIDAGVPTKVVLALKSSPSLMVTDPSGDRVAALSPFFSSLPSDTEVMVVAYAGASTADFTTGFRLLRDFTASQRAELNTRLLNFVGSGDATDHVAVLNALKEFIKTDAAAKGAAHYVAILLTDGVPSTQENELMCGDVVTQLVGASAGSTVRLNTMLVNRAPAPRCLDQVTVNACSVTLPPSGCTQALNDASAARLEKLATRGGGTLSVVLDNTPLVYSLH